MVSSKESELKALRNEALIKATKNISIESIKEITEALKGLTSCDVEKGTEPYWKSLGKERFSKLNKVQKIIRNLQETCKVEENTAIGAFRLRQKECVGKANLSIGRFKDVQRLVKRLTT